MLEQKSQHLEEQTNGLESLVTIRDVHAWRTFRKG